MTEPKKPMAWYSEVPDDQKISYSVTPLPGAMLRAELLGAQLRAMARLMRVLGDEAADGVKWETFVGNIGMSDGGTVTFDLVVLPRLPAPPQPKEMRDADA